jgi:hypothetical protein
MLSVSERERAEEMTDFVEESYEELLKYTSNVATLLRNHSKADYSSGLYTVDIVESDERIEEILSSTVEDAREALKTMESALQVSMEEINHEIVEEEFSEELARYRDLYLGLEEELRAAERTEILSERIGGSTHRRADFKLEDVEDFDPDTGEPATGIKQ